MTIFNRRIEHPWLAFFVIVFISVLFSNYGYTDGAAILFGIFAGIGIYKMLL